VYRLEYSGQQQRSLENNFVISQPHNVAYIYDLLQPQSTYPSIIYNYHHITSITYQ